MSVYKIQGKAEKAKGIYYEFDSADKPLGEGGMGKVYKGRCVNEKTGAVRNVAVKFMYSDLPQYAIEKARREAAIQFKHENLVEMLGFIETESKSVLGEPEHHYHVVSELLVGVSLDQMFQGNLTDQQGHFVPYAEKLYKDYQQDVNHFAVFLVKNILSGLMTMHDNGYIHRDIDPTNIMITADGRIKLIDFGIAKKMNNLTTGDKHLTQAGQFVGKPEYAAPELVLGAINEQNQTTDIYAVGILLFQCIVGHVPFEGDRSDILQKQIHKPLPLGLIKHKGLRRVIATATEKQRAKRFQSAAEFRVALDRIDANAGGDGEWLKKMSYVVGAAAVTGVLVFGSIWLLNHKASAPQSVPAPTVVQTAPEVPAPTAASEPVQAPEMSYSSAVKALAATRTQSDGLKALKKLSDEGDASASYLLSRVYFRGKADDESYYVPDSIRRIISGLDVVTNDRSAHQFLELAVQQDPTYYPALYDLACDYWKADQRTSAVSMRDGDKAEEYFLQAQRLAHESHDEVYCRKIDGYLDAIKRWHKNLDKLKH
jgi:serine/threonine-protein kinase